MRSRRTLFVFWLVASALWGQYVFMTWRQSVAPNQAQIAALDECGGIYPPRADGYAQLYSGSWSNWEYTEQLQHPHCAPHVGAIGFFDFVGMQAPARAALRQQSQYTIDTATRNAIVIGAAIPVGVLVIGLLMRWINRRLRPA